MCSLRQQHQPALGIFDKGRLYHGVVILRTQVPPSGRLQYRVRQTPAVPSAQLPACCFLAMWSDRRDSRPLLSAQHTWRPERPLTKPGGRRETDRSREWHCRRCRAHGAGRMLARAFETAFLRSLYCFVVNRARKNTLGCGMELLQAYPGDRVALESLVGPLLHLVAVVVRVEDLLGV